MSMSSQVPVDQTGSHDAPEAASSRRGFMRTVGLGAAAVGALAITGTALTGVVEAATPDANISATDAELLTFLASLEYAAEKSLYSAAEVAFVTSPTAQRLRLFARLHHDQGVALAAILPSATIVPINSTLQAQTDGNIAAATSEAGLLGVVQTLEENLSSTMLSALGQAQSWHVAEQIAIVCPVNGQEAAAIGFDAGQPTSQWLPAFASTTGALTQAAFPVR
ncbi:Twin-arginine translocation pathway, signal sequence, bacterial/archaeal [Acidimicrobiia bacterium]